MVDKNVPNPLDDLFTDAASQITPASLSAVLRPFIRINRETKRILFTPAGMALTANNKIIVFILARKAMHMQKLVDSDSVAPKDLKEEFGRDVPHGTIDAGLKRLSERGPIRGQGGRYFLPDFNFAQVQELLSKVKGK